MEVLFSAEEIAAKVKEMGADITRYYQGKDLTVIILASGGVFFGADLLRAIDLPLWVDTLGVASYVQDRSGGTLNVRSKLKLDCRGRHILLVDEVLDTGNTLRGIKKMLLEQGAESVRTAVIFSKPIERPPEVANADWTGFFAPDRYLVGYGLDSCELYRNLPYVGVLDK